MLLHTAPRYLILVHHILVHIAPCYYILLHSAPKRKYYYILLHTTTYSDILLYTTTFYYILLHTTTYYYILLHTTTYYCTDTHAHARVTLIHHVMLTDQTCHWQGRFLQAFFFFSAPHPCRPTPRSPIHTHFARACMHASMQFLPCSPKPGVGMPFF